MPPYKPIVPTAPTHTKFTRAQDASPQVIQSRELKANYYRSAAWRTGYEWRAQDELEEKEEQLGLRPKRGNTPPIQYSWQTMQTAKDFLAEAKSLNEMQARVRRGLKPEPDNNDNKSNDNNNNDNANVNGSGECKEPSPDPSQLPRRPSNPISDSLDALTQASPQGSFTPTTQPFHSISPFGDNQSQQQQPSSAPSFSPSSAPPTTNSSSHAQPYISTLAGFPITHNALPGAPGSISQRLPRPDPRTIPTSRTHAIPHTKFIHPIHSPANGAILGVRGGEKFKEFGSGMTGPNSNDVKAVNFNLRGAGALPTHRHTTRTSSVRLLAGLQDPSASTRHAHHPHASAHAHVANMDWSEWARQIEKTIAQNKGTLQLGSPKKNGAQTAR